MKTDRYTTVLTFTYPYEVVIVRGRLESEGIECFVQDELTVQVNPFYSNAIGGVKLQVRERDLKQAVEILKETGYLKDEDLQPDKGLGKKSLKSPKSDKNQVVTVNSQVAKSEKTKCPLCGSDEVVRTKNGGWLFLSLISLLIANIPAPLFRKGYYCFDCKRKFKYKKIGMAAA